MDHFLEWFLIYRDTNELLELAPEQAPETLRHAREPSGTNFFLEVRKPK